MAEKQEEANLNLLLLYSIHATYGRIQMTEMQKSLSETSMPQYIKPLQWPFAGAEISC